MRYRKFGNTGLLVSELCLGTSPLAGNARLQQADADRLIGRALDAGINFIDTAGAGAGAESLTGRTLRNLQVRYEHLVVATQYPGGTGGMGGGASRYPVMDAVIASLRRLRLDHIDLYRIDGFDRAAPVEETVRALEHLVQRGRLRCVGVSNRAARQIIDALGISAWLELEHFEPVEALSANSGLAVWCPPLERERGGSGAQAIRAIAQAKGVSPAQIALAWLLHQDSVASVIVGAGRLQELEDQLAATHIRLNAAELAALGEVSALPDEQPGPTPAFQAARRCRRSSAAGFEVAQAV